MSTISSTSHQYDLASARFFAQPEATFALMRERDPVYFDETLSAWILTKYDDVSEALRSPNLSVDRNGEIGRGGSGSAAPRLREVNAFISQWMVFSDPPRHTRLRSIVAKAFQPRAAQELLPKIRQTVDELLDRAEREGTFDALTGLGVPLAERITAHMLGLPSDSPKQLKLWTESLFQLLGAGSASNAVVHSSADGVSACREFIAALVRARREAPGDDMVTQIVRDGASEFTEEEVVGLVITLIAGAYETTAHTVANGLFALLRNPKQVDLLRTNPALIESAVEEILRFDGPALSVQRRAKRDLSIRGTPIKERDRIYCMLHAANHDPAVFSDPAMLDITRNPCRHLGLGLGPHFCLGAWLTRLESQEAILRAIQRFPELRLAGDDAPEWVASFAMRGLNQLVLSTSTRASFSCRSTAS
jgi:pimeloyl-[acyl-carrier protein] synthase